MIGDVAFTPNRQQNTKERRIPVGKYTKKTYLGVNIVSAQQCQTTTHSLSTIISNDFHYEFAGKTAWLWTGAAVQASLGR